MTELLAHADPIARAVETWLAAGHVDASTPLLVACSGGADSLALAAAVWKRTEASGAEVANPRSSVEPAGQVDFRPSAERAGRAVAAAVIDHALQPDSARVAATAAQCLHAMGYRRVEIRRVTVDGPGGVEAAARIARYDALREIAAELGAATAILLGHTADDQAETVLLGLGRGSGPRSIAGMRPWAEPFGRPLLGVRRADTEAACRAMGIEPWQDPHNSNSAFTRVRLRREVLPLLDEVLGGGVVPALARTAELMADDLAALDAIAERALAQARALGVLSNRNGGAPEPESDNAGHVDLDCAALAAWPSAVRRRVLRAWVRERAGITEVTFRHLVALEDVVMHGRSRQAVRLPGGSDAVRIGAHLALRGATPDAAKR